MDKEISLDLKQLTSLRKAYLRQLNSNYFNKKARNKIFENINNINLKINKINFQLNLERKISNGKFR